MKFAKFWRKEDVSVDARFFGNPTVSVWGASNSSNEEAMSAAKSRAARFVELISSDILNLQDYEYWNGYIREEIVEEVLSSDGRILAVLTRNTQ